MPPQPPPVDARTYEELRAELIDRIPVHTPEWTNHSPGDPGVTLLELFAFLGDSIIYRANRLPERARQRFLELLRLPVRPATAADGIVAFDLPRGPRRTIHLDPDLALAAGSVPFRTLTGLDVVPVAARAYVKASLPPERVAEVRETYEQLYAPLLGDAAAAFYETTPVTFAVGYGAPPLDVGASSVDGALWLALLAPDPASVAAAREAIGGAVLTIGVVPPLDATPRVLRSGALPSGVLPSGMFASGDGPAVAEEPGVRIDLPVVPPAATPGAARVPSYQGLDARVLADPFRPDGGPAAATDPRLIEVTLPESAVLGPWPELEPLEAGVGDLPPLLEGDEGERLVCWLRVRPGDATGDRVGLRLAWIGINAALVRQRAHVANELLGRGDGLPDQVVALASTPVLAPTVRITVDGVEWTRVEPHELAIAPGERGGPHGPVSGDAPADARVYTVDATTGEVRFGSGLHGARPRENRAIVASYDHGGGRAGLVPPHAINKGPALPRGLRVANPVPTWGADAAETVDEAERRIPAHLRHRDRAVTTDDVADIARAAPGVDLGRVEVLPLHHPDHPTVDVPGAMTVMVVPRFDPVAPDAPSPDRFALDRVCRHLAPRRLVTTEIHVRGPVYVPVWLAVGFQPVPGRDASTVREAIAAALRTWCSPLVGGYEGVGWPLDTPLARLGALAVVARVPGVAQVTDVLLTDATGAPRDEVTLAGLELPRLIAVEARRGDPPPLDDVVGGAPPPRPDGPAPRPVPVVPEEC